MRYCTTGLRQNGKPQSPVARICGMPPTREIILECGCGHSSGTMLICDWHLRRVDYGTYYCGECWDEGHRCETWTPGSQFGVNSRPAGVP